MKPTLRTLFLQHVGQTSPSPLMVEVERAEGVFFHSPDGKRYYDLIAGVTVNNVGHANPAVVEAVQRQAAEYMHVMVYGEMVERPQVEYASKITSLLPDGLDSVYFLNSGSEAVEGALKLAKRYTGRTELVSCRGAYHGSTQGSLSVMGGEEYKNAFRPLMPDTRLIEYNDLDDLAHITSRTAGVLVEPVQSESGVRPPAPGYLEALRKRCDEAGAMLIFDEIQTAFGRVGGMFATLKYGVTPDILCLAKALGGGMPLGAFVSSKEIMDTLSVNPALGHITTFGGHPVCCAAGLAALDYTIKNNLAERAEPLGALYESLLAGHPAVREIRRAGLLIAVELGSSERMFSVMAELTARGILSDWFLFCETAFRISPPLVITEEQVRDSARIVAEALDTLPV
jgi:acetylornithine/succinyldiaminopimelate/putrescine aminotransferase